MSIQHNDQINNYSGSPNVAPDRYVLLAGTISSIGQLVTGVGTSFLTDISGFGIGDVSYVNNNGWIFNGTNETMQIKSVVSDTILVLKQGFTVDLSAGTAFKYVPHSRTQQMSLRSESGTGMVNGITLGARGYTGWGFSKSSPARTVDPVVITSEDGDINVSEFLGAPNVIQVEAGMNVDTNTIIASVEDRVLGSTTFDLSVDYSIAGNTTLFNNVRLVNFKYLLWPSGQVILWSYYQTSGGDGWNSREQDAVDRDIDYETEQDGELYNGGVPYGRDFYTEATELIVAAGVTQVGIGVNIASPLCPYSNDGDNPEIDWDVIDIGSVCDQIAIAVERAHNAGLEVYVFEVGMEMTVLRQADLVNKVGHIMNPGDPEEGGAVVAQLITWTNTTSSVSIIDTMRTLCPTAFISIDSKQWDNMTINYPNWNAQVSATPVDGLRQYFQFETEFLATYEDGRDHIADDVPVFMAFIQDADFNGKRTFVSQVAFKFGNPVRGAYANGLLLGEVMMKLALESALAGNILKGVTHMSIVAMVDQPDNFSPTVVFYFEQVLGLLFLDNCNITTVTFDDADISTNCVVLAFSTPSETRIGVLNPTINTYTVSTGLSINGFSKSFTTTQIYSPTLDVYDENQTTIVEQDVLNFRPLSFTVIVANN